MLNSEFKSGGCTRDSETVEGASILCEGKLAPETTGLEAETLGALLDLLLSVGFLLAQLAEEGSAELSTLPLRLGMRSWLICRAIGCEVDETTCASC